MKKKSLFSKLFSQKDIASESGREYLAETLDARVLYSAAPVDISDQAPQEVVVEAADEFTSVDRFASNTELPLGESEIDATNTVVITDQQNLTAAEAEQLREVEITAMQLAMVEVETSFDIEAARDQILDGVTELTFEGNSEELIIFGDNAYGIANFAGQGNANPAIAVTTLGEGSILTLASQNMLDMQVQAGNPSMVNLYNNSITFLGGDLDAKIVVYNNQSNADYLSANNYTNVVLVTDSNIATELADADVLISGSLRQAEAATFEEIHAFVSGGGGLLLANGERTSTIDVQTNAFLRETGIAYRNDYWGTEPSPNLIERATGQITLDSIHEGLVNPGSQSYEEQVAGAQTLRKLLELLPTDSPEFSEILPAFWQRVEDFSPTPDTPVSGDLELALLDTESTLLRDIPVDEITAHRTAEATYGAIPEGAERITQTYSIDTSRTGWIATGAYAVAGEVVTITVPQELVDIGAKIRINAHTDDVLRRGTLERMPYVHRIFDIDNTTVEVGSAFGGNVFIELPGGRYGEPLRVGPQEIVVEGAIEAPFFDLNQHTNEQWINELRDNPAPYAVFSSDGLIIVQRSSESAELEQAEELLRWWNNTVIGQDWLSGRITDRTGAELINVDVQNSAGAAHAGYPIQAYDKFWGNLTDYDRLVNGGSWGDFHELGHNHQRGWWTFSGDVEVTVNIFSQFNLASIDEVDPNTSSWNYSVDSATTLQRSIDDIEIGGSYSDKDNRWSFWFALGNEFGPEAYRNVFMSYEIDNRDDPSKLPTNDQEEKDQFYVRWSREVGYDMTAFMVDTWGLEVSEQAKATVAAMNLDSWLPVATTVEDIQTISGRAVEIDLASRVVSLDGIAEISVGDVQNGTLVDNGDGTYTYTNDANFQGDDSFTFTVTSSQGNSKTYTVNIESNVGGLLEETWTGIEGDSLDSLRSNPDFPEAADQTRIINSFETRVNHDNNYGTKVSGYLTPAETGEYTFFIASDDNGELRLSTDSNPENAALIANVPGWSSYQQWDKFTAQKSVAFTLEAGQSYYIEGLVKEGGGGDHLSVAWTGPGIGETPTVISSQYLSNVPNPGSTAQDQQVTVLEDGRVVIDLTGSEAGDIDLSGFSQGSFGSVSLHGTDCGCASCLATSVVYSPERDYNGEDSFTYTIEDSNGNVSRATVEVDVVAVNDAPVVNNDSYSVTPGISLEVDSEEGLLSNDSDVDGDDLHASIVSAPANGEVIVNRDGSFVYIPGEKFSGSDSFVYQVSDRSGGVTQGTVTLVENSQGLRAQTWFGIDGNSLSTLRDHPNYPETPDTTIVLDDFETRVDYANSYGTRVQGYITAPETGDYTFYLASDDNGELWLSDSTDLDNAELISSVPGWTSVRQWDKFSSQKSTTISLQAGERYYVEALVKEGGGGDHLAVAWTGPGIGDDITIIAGEHLTVYGVDLAEEPVNELPEAGNERLTVRSGQEVIIQIDDLLANDFDRESTLDIGSISAAIHGLITNNGDGTLTYFANSDFSGEDSFTYTVVDADGGFATARVDITVAAAVEDIASTGLVAHLSFESDANDVSTNGFQNNAILEGARVENGSLVFSGDGGFATISDSEDINTAVHAERTIAVSFVAENVEGRSVIYEEGGKVKGANIYIDEGNLYVGVWNIRDDHFEYHSVAIEAGVKYDVVIATGGGKTPDPEGFHAYINGELFAVGNGMRFEKHGNGIGVGGLNSRTRFHDGEIKEADNFSGSIDDLRIYNRILSQAEVTSLHSFVNVKPVEAKIISSSQPKEIPFLEIFNILRESSEARLFGGFETAEGDSRRPLLAGVSSPSSTITVSLQNEVGLTTQQIVVNADAAGNWQAVLPTDTLATSAMVESTSVVWEGQGESVTSRVNFDTLTSDLSSIQAGTVFGRILKAG